MNDARQTVNAHSAIQSALPPNHSESLSRERNLRFLASLLFADDTPEQHCGMFRHEPGTLSTIPPPDNPERAAFARLLLAGIVVLAITLVAMFLDDHQDQPFMENLPIIRLAAAQAATVVHHTASFVVANMPTPTSLLLGGLPALLWASACLTFAGLLKRRFGVRTGYTRKTFHFLIFSSVVIVNLLWGTQGVCLFGAMTSLVIFSAIVCGSGNILYEAMAREKDAPYRTYFVIVPYLATLVGGMVSNVLFGQAAVVGYLVTGLGDAVGEPVGTRFGRHTYSVPSLGQLASTRSIEGSAAVCAVCLVAIASGLFLACSGQFSPTVLLVVPAFALLCTMLEAVSPHGWDNATLQIVPSFVAYLILG